MSRVRVPSPAPTYQLSIAGATFATTVVLCFYRLRCLRDPQTGDIVSADRYPEQRNPKYPVQLPFERRVCVVERIHILRLAHRDLEHTSDAQLVTLCLDGDQSAWEELVNRYSRLVYSIAFRSGIDASAVDDVVQNVFVTVLRRLESLRERDRFSSWLITTTRRESWHYKSGNREIALDEDLEVADSSSTVEESVIEWEEAHITHLAMKRLGDRCRTLLTAVFLMENRPSYQDISEELGIAVGSIGPIRARCLKQLRSHLAELGIEQ